MWKSSIVGRVFLLLAWLYLAPAYGQRVETLQASKDITSIEKDIARQLSKEQPAGLVRDGLARDRRVVEKATPEAVYALKHAGYSSDDAASALAWSWYTLRLGKGSLPLTKELSTAMIQAKVVKLGKLAVNSEPNGAAIFVDKAEWPDPTNATGFADAGQRRVRVAKSGMQPAETTCDVLPNRVATFSAKLLVSGSKAECK